jgi:hypothetical protein
MQLFASVMQRKTISLSLMVPMFDQFFQVLCEDALGAEHECDALSNGTLLYAV